MRLPKRSQKEKENTSPEDTQEMFAAGAFPAGSPEETVEYELPTEEEVPAPPIEGEEGVEEVEEVEEADEEAWDDDEYDEWDEEPEEVEEETLEGDEVEVRSPGLAVRARSAAAGLFRRIGDIRLPRKEIDGQKVLAGTGILAVALMVGAGGYVLGKGSGDDVDTARLKGEFAGKRAGAVAGATKGYATGFERGREAAFRKAYAASYRRNYIRAYEDAGMEPPKPKEIKVPKP